MRARLFRSPILPRIFRGVGLAAVVTAAVSCQDFDTTRQAPPKATLGDDLYGVLCDRVGASSLGDDVTGASYHGVCHYSKEGVYADKVDTSVLPAVSGADQEKARTLGIAKVEAMARRRGDLVHAFNALLPDVEIDDVSTAADGDKVRLHDAMFTFAQSLSRLYDSNPLDAKAPPTVPASTRALAEIFSSFVDSQPAREALSKIWGRQGYRPTRAALGVVRPVLSYPRLRPLLKSALEVLAPGGKMAPELDQLLTVLQRELGTYQPKYSSLPPLTVDASKAQPSRPMETLELLSRVLLEENPAYAKDPMGAPLYIARRDRRGFVVPAGNVPGQAGTVPAPFTDKDGDGYADIDNFGRFLTDNNVPVPSASPFISPSAMGVDKDGRPNPLVYTYIDTSRTLIGAVTQDLAPLVDSTQYAPNGGDDAWQSEHETLMYAVAGAEILLGDREKALYDHTNAKILPADADCPDCTPYMRFRGEDSPIADLIHATGQLIADKDSDAVLMGLIDLVENHEDVVARLLGAALKVRSIALAHDQLAAQGKEPLAQIPYETPIWDEVASVMARIMQTPGLTSKLIATFADPSVVTPKDNAQNIGDALSKYMAFRDGMTYNADDLNGPSWNVTEKNTLDPKNLVDRTKPQVGDNRSEWERILRVIHNANNVKACNKNGAKVKAKLGNLTLTWPLLGSGYSECDLFQFDNLAAFYLDSILPIDHPKRSELKIKAGELDALIKFLGVFTSKDKLFEESSGITGLTLHPEPKALNRLVFFGADSDQFPAMPDLDPYIGNGEKNAQTNGFISNVIEPVPTVICAKQPSGTRKCATEDDTLRLLGRDSLFLLERFNFYPYLQPLVVTFSNATCNSAGTVCQKDANGNYKVDGEVMFTDLIEIMNRHWPGPDHGPDCSKSGTPDTNPAYCSGVGVNRYEPIISEAFAGDVIPALHEFAKVLAEVSKITVVRGPDAGKTYTGADIIEKAGRVMFDPTYAANVKMVDRKGNASTTWTDGTPQAQLTGFTLLADALHGMDLRFDAACNCNGKTGQELADCQAAYDTCRKDAERRHGQWKRARSQLVDQFLSIDGEGAASKFANPAIPKALVSILKAMREQLNAHCPDRESGTECTWAKKDMGQTIADGLSGPLTASLVDVLELVRKDENARREVEKLLEQLMRASSPGDALQSTLGSLADALQVLLADAEIAPILTAASPGLEKTTASGGKGPLPSSLDLLRAITSDEYDKYHVMDYVLPNLVTPMDDGNGPTPLEVIMDTVAEVNRIDASSSTPLDPTDYEYIMKTARDFLTSDTRGLEQIYTIVKNRPRE